jgi:antirestriction protein ArdC
MVEGDPSQPDFPALFSSAPPDWRNASVADLVTRLDTAVRGIQESDLFQRYLAAQARFHSYSWGNVLLILGQRPTASRVASYRTWQSLGRQVRRGETGIRIVVPMRRRISNAASSEGSEADGADVLPVPMPRRVLYFGTGVVFDVAQTDGDPLPEVRVPLLDGPDGPGLGTRLERMAQAEGITVERVPEIEGSRAVGTYSPSARRIIVRELEPAQMTKTLAHELAHHFAEADRSSPEEETVAESVAYVVCAHYGLDTGARSFPYVATWAEQPQVLKAAMTRIQTVSTTMIRLIDAQEPLSPERSHDTA